MANYWVSFTVHKGDRAKGTYDVRRDSIYAVAQGPTKSNPHWVETTSFILFTSGDDIDVVGKKIVAGLDGAVDVLLIGKVGVKADRYWGAVKDTKKLISLYPTMTPLK